MKKYIFLFLIFSFIGSHFVFGSSTQGMSGPKVSKIKRKSINLETKTQLLAIFKSNEKLHKSFFQYSKKDVEKNAQDLKSRIESLKNPEISKLLNFSKSKLSEIKENRDRKENNKSYHMVSGALILVMKRYDIGPDYGGFYCPMVKKKWVQNVSKNKDVRNPYAPEMPACGVYDLRF